MPIYEYQCHSCKSVFEVMQKISDPSPSHCESCGKGPVEKIMSMTSFSLKGTGWYVTDFRGPTPSQGKKDTENSEKPSPESSGNKSTTEAAAPASSSQSASGSDATKANTPSTSGTATPSSSSTAKD